MVTDHTSQQEKGSLVGQPSAYGVYSSHNKCKPLLLRKRGTRFGRGWYHDSEGRKETKAHCLLRITTRYLYFLWFAFCKGKAGNGIIRLPFWDLSSYNRQRNQLFCNRPIVAVVFLVSCNLLAPLRRVVISQFFFDYRLGKLESEAILVGRDAARLVIDCACV